MFRHAQFETVQAYLANPANGALPLHARVQRAIRQMILDGALSAGKPLPATRVLAKSLGISRDTVEAAYSQLHAEGFITRRTGSGSFVSEKTDFPTRQGARRHARQDLLYSQAPALSVRGAAILASGGVREHLSPRPFAPGVPETRTFPLALWERLHRQVLAEYGTRALSHGDPQGAEVLRRAIADYINLERGAQASAECVLVLTSSQQALTLCATVLFDPGDGVLIEDPVYQGARKAFDAAGLSCIPVPVDAEGIQVEHLRSLPDRAKAVFLTPSHQFPTGSTLALERRLVLIEWAKTHQAWIIEDDYDSEFHYSGRPTACVQGLDHYNRTIYIGTFTKSLFPGLRLGYVVLPPQLVQPMTVARTLLDGHSASIAQLTLARFIEGGHFGAHIRSMRKIYAARLAVLERAVRCHLAGIVDPKPPQGGMQMPCLLTGAFSESDSINAARGVGIDLIGLSKLYASDSAKKAGWLMGFAAYTPDEIDNAVRRLAAVLKG